MNSYRPKSPHLFLSQYPAKLGVAYFCFENDFVIQDTDAGSDMQAFFLAVVIVR
jgi:hypothetical protein